MASVEDLWMDGRRKLPAHGKGKRWQVRWRDSEERQCKRRFRTKDEAVMFAAEQQLDPETRTDTTVAELWPRWIATKVNRKQSTRDDYRLQWRLRVKPKFGHRAVSSITHTEISSWAAKIASDTSTSTANRSLVVLRGVLEVARRQKLVKTNEAVDIKLGAEKRREAQFLTIAQLETLARECHPHELVVWTLAMTGIRFGEMCALDVADLDVKRRRLRVAKARPLKGEIGLTKTYAARDVPVPGWLATELAEKAEKSGPLLPTQRGGRWSHSSWRRIWRTHKVQGVEVEGAIERAGLPDLRVHDLRHTAASLAIAAGANPSVVQRMLGHKSATMTMDLYRHLWDSELDDVAERLGKMRKTG